MIARSGKEARYRSMNVKGKGCGAAATSSGCQCWVATIYQDTIKFSSSAVQIRAIIERFFLEPSVFILLDSTLDREFFLSLESGSASLSYRGEKLRRRISRLVYQRDVGPTPEEGVRRRTTQSKVR